MPQRLKELGADTLVPLGFVLVLYGVVVAFTNLQNESRANSNDIKDIRIEQKERMVKLDRIIQKLGRIEYQLGIKEE